MFKCTAMHRLLLLSLSLLFSLLLCACGDPPVGPESTSTTSASGTPCAHTYTSTTTPPGPLTEGEELPIGSVILLDEGYRYRPDAWVHLDTITSPRPGDVTKRLTLVDEAWWGSYSYRAFNLSRIEGNIVMQDEDAGHLRIYVPIQNS